MHLRDRYHGLAVTLAKLSLWLISAAKDKALSFIDHHLKEGNSIIGTDRHQVKTSSQVGPLFETSYQQIMGPVISRYNTLNEIGSATKEDVEKQKEIYNEIQSMLQLIKKKYDYYLASQYAGGIKDEYQFASLLRSDDISDFDQPDMEGLWQIAKDKKFFHWELEFPEVFLRWGFDIAIGNPPYVDVTAEEYKYLNLRTINTRNLYSFMMEISIDNLKNSGYFGFIVPLSSMYTPRMSSLQNFMTEEKEVYISSFAIRPAKIFKNVEQRICIFFGKKLIEGSSSSIYTTGYIRWYARERKKLFDCLQFSLNDCKERFNLEVVPKVGSAIEIDILNKLYSKKKKIKDYVCKISNNSICYHGAVRYWLKAFNYIPEFYSERKGISQSSEYKSIYFTEDIDPNIIVCLINSSLFYWYWLLMSDERHFLRKDIEDFPFDINDFDQINTGRLDFLAEQLMKSYRYHSSDKTVNLGGRTGIVRYYEFRPRYSKHIIDEIDHLLGEIYGISDREIKFIVNYDTRFRMGDDEGELISETKN
ncbi:hypothetical protein SCACP_17230 [Sporomusa carbonis]